MTGDGDKRGETESGVGTKGELGAEGEDSSAGEREGEGGVGMKVPELSPSDNIGFHALEPIIGSKLSGRLDFGP